MNFKKYHVSRNLIDIRDFTATTTPTSQDGVLWTGTLAEGTYTFSINQDDTLTSSLRNTIHIKIGSANYYESTSANYHNNSGRHSYTFTVPDATTIIEIRYWTNVISNDCSFSQGMLNTGSTPLPYEPYSSEVWHDIPHYIHNTSTDTITTLPAVIYANDTTATVGLKGNMEQSSQPSPTTPIQPSECGDKTANLLDVTLFHNGYHINSQGNIEIFTGRIVTTTPIDVSNYTSVTFSYTTTRDNDNFIYATFSGNTLVERVAGKTSGFTIDTTNCDKLYLCLYNLSSQVLTVDIITAMLNEGSTPLPYEPYGYFIEIEVS